jgi:hypothetical protein
MQLQRSVTALVASSRQLLALCNRRSIIAQVLFWHLNPATMLIIGESSAANPKCLAGCLLASGRHADMPEWQACPGPQGLRRNPQGKTCLSS